MKVIVFAFLALSLAGCSALGIGGKKENRELTDITCSGFVGWEACHAKAQAMCPKGYDVLMKDESLIAQRRTMRVACN
jgi:hypothetical protein